jgi:hypothetical protein
MTTPTQGMGVCASDRERPLSGAESAQLRQLVELEQEVAGLGEALRAEL